MKRCFVFSRQTFVAHLASGSPKQPQSCERDACVIIGGAENNWGGSCFAQKRNTTAPNLHEAIACQPFTTLRSYQTFLGSIDPSRFNESNFLTVQSNIVFRESRRKIYSLYCRINAIDLCKTFGEVPNNNVWKIVMDIIE